MNAKSIKNDLKKGLVFRTGNVLKITKIQDTFQMVSRSPKRFKNHQKMNPRASKISQNHENLVTQNRENPRKKTSRFQEIKMRHGGGFLFPGFSKSCFYDFLDFGLPDSHDFE